MRLLLHLGLTIGLTALVACGSARTATPATVPTAARTAQALAVTPTTAAPTVRPALVPTTPSASPPAAGVTRTPAASPPANEDALAQSLLLPRSLFPASWSERPSDTGMSPLVACDPPTVNGKRPNETGAASTGDFSPGGTTALTEKLSLYDTPAHAAAALDEFAGTLDCVEQGAQAGKLDNPQVTYTQATLSPVSFPTFGDRTAARRLQLQAKLTGQTGPTSEVEAYLDLVTVQVGRVAFLLEATDLQHPYDPSDLQQRVAEATRLVQQGLPR